MNKYRKHTDFLKDELFLYWRLNPTKELDEFWEEYISQNNNQEVLIKKAIEEFDNIREQRGIFGIDENPALETLKKKISDSITRHKKTRIKKFAYSAAAIFICAVVSTLFFYNKNYSLPNEELTSIGKIMNDSSVVLITGNKTHTIINNSTLKISENNISTIDKEGGSVEVAQSVHAQNNILTVPYGKRASLILSDGSEVHLNSGTKLEFPAVFTGNKREINVEGEIFIDVKKDDSKPFIINTPKSMVRVFGTSINIASYSEDMEESVVLVTGKVEVVNANKSIMLDPGEIAKITESGIMHEKVNVSEYTSWVNGHLELNKVPLSDVLTKVSRYYNVKFNYSRNLDLQSKTCSGKLFLSDNLSDVLNSFSKLTFLNYEKEPGSDRILIYE